MSALHRVEERVARSPSVDSPAKLVQSLMERPIIATESEQDPWFGDLPSPTRQQVLELDTSEVQSGRFSVRHAYSLHGAAFARLKASIQSVGRNLDPISVRACGDGAIAKYEVVSGYLRYRACKELGIPVVAVIDQCSDEDAVRNMIQVDSHRMKLTPYEKGCLFKAALNAGVWPSSKEAAKHVGLTDSQVYRLVKLASLPIEVIQAFVSPTQMKSTWGTVLGKALRRNEASVIHRALEIARDQILEDPEEVFEELDAAAPGGEGPARKVIRIEKDESLLAEIVVPLRKKNEPLVVRVQRGVISAAELAQLLRKELGSVLTDAAEVVCT